jgi:hypothetical protein
MSTDNISAFSFCCIIGISNSIFNVYISVIEVIVVNSIQVTLTAYPETKDIVILDSVTCERITVGIANINSPYIAINLIS